MKFSQKGFTLIELLVVIAIIGLLSAVIMGPIGDARDRGSDAAIKSDLANTRAQAEIQYNNTGHYGTQFTPEAACPGAGGASLFGNTVLASQIEHAKNSSGGLASCHSIGTPTATLWAIAVQLKSDRSKAFCVDSSGASKVITNGGVNYANQAALNAEIVTGLCGS